MTLLQLIADPKPKPQPKRRCISAAEVGEVTLIHRGWIPNFTPKGGGGPWPSDIAAFYAEHAKIGPPLAAGGTGLAKKGGKIPLERLATRGEHLATTMKTSMRT